VNDPSVTARGARQGKTREVAQPSETAQLQLAALVRTLPARVLRAIHFDDETDAECEEVSDELPADRRLAAQRDAPLPSLQGCPKAAF
jgi:hypothetical protein